MIALDTETTGIDLFHGAKPFLVTTCNEDGRLKWWQWDVNPVTREVEISEEDALEIRQLLAVQHDGIVLHNAKFDAHALYAGDVLDWAPLWELTHDTLLISHILASNQPHNLTDLAIMYLGHDIRPKEEALKRAVNEARRLARSKFPEWRIAKEGLPGMPSAKSGSKKDRSGVESESPWHFDMWLPRAIARWMDYGEDHDWYTVASDYANEDSSTTMLLHKVLRAELERRGKVEQYEAKRKNTRVLWEMERAGVTVSLPELRSLQAEYAEEKAEAEAVCAGIAKGMGCELSLPKAGNNLSLIGFVFGELDLPVVKRTEKGSPSLDKEAMEEYKLTLPLGPKLDFVRNLAGARKRAKSLEYLLAYDKFGIQDNGSELWLVLHPSTNPTGTTTTRLSMSNPNLQQVSKQETQCEACEGEGCEECGGSGEDLHSVRRVFGPAPGREWWTLDAENIELRLPAYESGEPELIALFEKPDEPPFYGSQHLLNFSIVYEGLWRQELEAVGPDKVGPYCKKKYKAGPYQYTKNGDFAIQYQCGEATADKSFRRRGAYRKLKDKFARLNALNNKWTTYAEEYGCVETMFGYPLLCARGDYGRIKPTLPLNYRTQGTAGDWMIRAMNRCHDKLEEWNARGFDGRIVLTVHDELVFDFPKRGDPVRASQGLESPQSNNFWRVKILKQLMEQGGQDISIPTPVSVSYCPKNWAEGVTI